jgi:hypothetical protein
LSVSHNDNGTSPARPGEPLSVGKDMGEARFFPLLVGLAFGLAAVIVG